MNFVTLKKDGILARHVGEGNNPVDVSAHAIEFLFEPCELGSGVVLKDIFLLIQSNPELFHVFNRFRAKDLVKEALAEYSDPKELNDSPDCVEYLELFKIVDDSSDGSYEIWPRIFVQGVSYPFKEDTMIDGFQHLKGSRINYGMLGSSPADSINLPLKFDSNKFRWHGTNKFGKRSIADDNFKFLDLGLPSLGELILGLLYDFSFFGVGDEREEFENILTTQKEWSDLEEDLPR